MSDARVSRKDVLKLGASLGVAALAGSPFAVGQNSTARPPNILFIVVDQLCSLSDLPSSLSLPNFRRMLRRGVDFRNYHVHQAPCGPSRSAIYTGQHVQKTGVYTNPPGEYAVVDPSGPAPVELPPNFMTIGKLLRTAGYYTAYKGKWHLSMIDHKVRAATPPRSYPDTSGALEAYGFADYGFDGETTGMMWAGFGHDGFMAADAIDLLQRFANGQTKGLPWYLAVNFINPHDIMFFAGDDEERGASRIGIRLPAPLVPPYDKVWNTPLPASLSKDDLSGKPNAQRRLASPGASGRRDEDDWRTYRSYYFNCIRDVDRYIGQVLDAVERFGFGDNTIIVLTSDHGEMAGAHGLSGKGGYIYKENLRVPLIVSGPGIPRGKSATALAGSVDLTPTLLSLAGVGSATRTERHPDLRGVDLSPVLANPSARTSRDERGVLFNFLSAPGGTPAVSGDERGRTQLRGVFDGRYKYARYFAINQHHVPSDWRTLTTHNDLELYDTKTDPDEIVNLAAAPETHRDLILSLNSKVNRLIAEEIGADDGSVFPGGAAAHQLKA